MLFSEYIKVHAFTIETIISDYCFSCIKHFKMLVDVGMAVLKIRETLTCIYATRHLQEMIRYIYPNIKKSREGLHVVHILLLLYALAAYIALSY